MSVDIALSCTFKIRSKCSYLCGKSTEIAAQYCCGGRKNLSRSFYRFKYFPRHFGPQYKVCSFKDFESKTYFVV